MSRKTKEFAHLYLFSLLILCSQFAFSSSYDPLNSEINFVSGNDFSSDVMSIVPPNSAGISINRFITFAVDDKPLQIINHGNSSGLPTTIVIVANNIHIRNRVEVLGAAADILFLSEFSSGQISCISCELENVYRVSMVTNRGSANLRITDTTIGQLRSAPSSRITLDNVKAPGAISLDVVGGIVDTRNTIDLNQRAVRAAEGGYRQSDNGNLVIGSGVVNIMLGEYTWNYDQQYIVGNSLQTTTSPLLANIKAVGIKISASANFSLQGNLNTNTDVLTSVRYRGNVKLAQEELYINSYGNVNPSIANATLTSNGDVAIKVKDNVTISSNTQINGKKIELIAGGHVEHFGSSRANNIGFAAGSFTNEGMLRADLTVKGWAEDKIINRHGAEIIADTVSLQADARPTSLVLNGSRTPYEFPVSGHLPIFPTYFEDTDPAQVGTYYTAGIHRRTGFTGLSVPVRSSAHIRARNIDIKTRAFENINPYFEIVDQSLEGVVLDRDRYNQVSVIAEQSLEIIAQRYIVNSSALLGAERNNAEVRLETGILTNERYRVLTVLDMEFYSERSEPLTNEELEALGYANSYAAAYGYAPVATGTSRELILSKNAIYSPPGVLFSLGGFSAEVSDLFINSIGFFEVYGDARFKTARLLDVGIENQQAEQNRRITHYASTQSGVAINTNDIIEDPEEMDSLFYVAGDSQATEANISEFRNYSPFRKYLGLMLARVAERYNYVEEVPTLSHGGVFDTQYYANATDDLISSFINSSLVIGGDLSTVDDAFYVHWSETQDYYVDIGGGTLEQRSSVVAREEELSVFGELKALFTDIAEEIFSFVNEINWWN